MGRERGFIKDVFYRFAGKRRFFDFFEDNTWTRRFSERYEDYLAGRKRRIGKIGQSSGARAKDASWYYLIKHRVYYNKNGQGIVL